MIERELKDVLMTLLLVESKDELMKALYRRFELVLLSEIKVDDYEKISNSLYTIRNFIGSEE